MRAYEFLTEKQLDEINRRDFLRKAGIAAMYTGLGIAAVDQGAEASNVSNDITVNDVVACGLYMQSVGDPRIQDLMSKVRAAGISEKRFMEVVKAETLIKNQVGRAEYMKSAKQSCKALGYDF